ncbi:phage tail protein [Aurantiacibacter marinus]|uniref:Phage tail collar domain-containing protein n=2 Tax=Aurantiacibacter marinus TaxID=874156 RepID=A0A0H0XKZ6_9SPHN|nr:tail fiber protein [Aurantiacibacter marinus]KLI63009.1 hypothetical protein AAV99_12065 [Aurantiacibacter marinus]
MAASLSFAAPAQAQSEPFIGQLMLTGANFCPRGWANAEGQLLPISSNSALFSLLGTTYGGDGESSFGLPDLRGRAPIGQGRGPGLADQRWGQRGGSESFTITEAQMPSHRHTAGLSVNALESNTNQPARSYPAVGPVGTNTYYRGTRPPYFMAADAFEIFPTGGNQSVNKRSPYLAMYWCIAMQGIYPSRS